MSNPEHKEVAPSPIAKAAAAIRSAKYLVAFTGAGISTSCGLPDYRGENGIRSRKRRRQPHNNGADVSKVNFPCFESLRPSLSHLALALLLREGKLKYIVSQNVDGLHRKSGVRAHEISELHGNATTGRCDTCAKIYESHEIPAHGLCNYSACASQAKNVEMRLQGRTRRANGRIRRFVVGFDEEVDISMAVSHCKKADTALILGTSLKVYPFADLATKYAQTIILINVGPTNPKLDNLAERDGVRINMPCDEAMMRILGELGYPKEDLEQYESPPVSNPMSSPFPWDDESVVERLLAGVER